MLAQSALPLLRQATHAPHAHAPHAHAPRARATRYGGDTRSYSTHPMEILTFRVQPA